MQVTHSRSAGGKRGKRAADAARGRGSEPSFRSAGAGNLARVNLYDEVTARIIAEMEAGRVPWVQPWGRVDGASAGLPRNALTGLNYSGINVLILRHSTRSNTRVAQGRASAARKLACSFRPRRVQPNVSRACSAPFETFGWRSPKSHLGARLAPNTNSRRIASHGRFDPDALLKQRCDVPVTGARESRGALLAHPSFTPVIDVRPGERGARQRIPRLPARESGCQGCAVPPICCANRLPHAPLRGALWASLTATFTRQFRTASRP